MKKINSKDWKFHQLLKLKDVANTVADELYHELNLSDQLELVWESPLDNNGTTFGSLFKQLVTEKLEEQVMIAFQEKFESATVNFGNEKSITPSVPVEKPASLTEKYSQEEQLPLDELMLGKDITINENASLEEKDGMVETRAGNVKVERV
tara:strand:- start:724 stop:1176 length:453 start_codon:yes stop_codon:yes gene_type:complete